MEPIRFDLPTVEYDEEGFTKSFTRDQVDEYVQFFEEYGLIF